LIYLFDTSGINRLHDDPVCDAIVTGLITTNVVWVSALNVAEAAQTSEPTRRESLLRLLQKLAQGRRPLETPPLLIRRAIDAYSKGLPKVYASVETENQDVYTAILNPNEVDEDTRREVTLVNKSLEKDFIAVHRAGRPHLQNLVNQGQKLPRSAAGLLRAYASNDAFLHDVVNSIYEKVVGAPLPKDRILHLLGAVRPLTGFLLAWGHSIYRRGIARFGYGTNNAGNIDLGFAVYLADVDIFITNDKKQYQALRLVTRMFAERCKVLKYETFRRRIVLDIKS
jgi:hypothetical protein